MGCCEATNPALSGFISRPEEAGRPSWADLQTPLDRRTAVKGMLAGAAAAALTACGDSGGASGGEGDGESVRLAFCGQLLCVVPYEVTRARGRFAEEGLDVELVYTRGGSAAMQALVGGAVDYAGTSFDVALQARSNNAAIQRFASTGRLPLFALAVGPEATDAVTEVADLEGRTVGISGLGNADHALLLFLLDEAGVDPDQVAFASIGTNLYDALRIGQVDAGMLQEPALSLILEIGGRELVNFMELEDARQHLGGAYEFMGVSVRAEEREERLDQMQRLAAALQRGLVDTRTIPPGEIIAALPESLVAGGDMAQLRRIIERYRSSLYPETVNIDRDAAERVVRAQEIAGLLEVGEIDLGVLLDTETVGPAVVESVTARRAGSGSVTTGA